MNPTNYTPSRSTVSELKRQSAFAKTLYQRYEDKHQASQAKLAEKINKLDQQVAIAEELENLDEAAK